jgi:phosphoglycolate phosphatase-like HAD superfamily hydrolase
VLTGGAGGRAMVRAFEQLFGIPDAFAGQAMAGRTDWWIITDALRAHGIDTADPRVGDFSRAYLDHLARELPVRPPGKRHGVMPGVRPLLDALAARDDRYLALLTGNAERAAQMKLEHFDLWRYFACGAFGDAAADRNGLLAKAIARVEACGGPTVEPRRTAIVGDTPLDIAVAVSGGARSIGVATGSSSVEELRAAGADVVFEDLSDTDAVISALDGTLQ